MKIFTLNIKHGGGKRIESLLLRLEKQNADVIVLTEFRENNNAFRVKEFLLEKGYKWQSSCIKEKRVNSVFIASRRNFENMVLPGLPESCSSRVLMAKFSNLIMLAVYFAQKEEKKVLFDYISNNCLSFLSPKGVIIGDFNTGKPYLDENARTFSCINEFINLETIGLVDSWRSRNLDLKEFSWYSHLGNGFRLDHVFSTFEQNKTIRQIGYDHAPRIEKETDHSAMYVEFED